MVKVPYHTVISQCRHKSVTCILTCSICWDIANRRTRVHCKCGYIPRMRTVTPLGGKQTVVPLDQWDCLLEWSCGASTGLPPSNLTGALTGHCVAKRRRIYKEQNGTGEKHVVCEHVSLSHHRAKPSEAPTEGRRSHWLFTSLVWSLVKHHDRSGSPM